MHVFQTQNYFNRTESNLHIGEGIMLCQIVMQVNPIHQIQNKTVFQYLKDVRHAHNKWTSVFRADLRKHDPLVWC